MTSLNTAPPEMTPGGRLVNDGLMAANAQTDAPVSPDNAAHGIDTENAMTEPATDSKTAMFWQMIEHFEAAGMPYCLLAGYDEFPQNIASDVDFMISPAWEHRLPALINSIAAACGAQLIQALPHETTATYYVVARLQEVTITYLHPDSSSDYRRGGHTWLDAESVLARRQRHAQDFWVPAAEDAFAYYLIKKIDKCQLDAAQAAELTARYAEDPAACTERLYALLPQDAAGLVHNAVVRASAFDTLPWTNVRRHLPQIREAMHSHVPSQSWPARLRQYGQDLQRMLRRCLQPTGLHIVFLGPDGSGKSSVIAAVSHELAQAFRRVEYRHLRPGRLPSNGSTQAVTDPHAKGARGKAGSIAKLLHFWTSYLIGSLLWLYPRKVRSTLVVFDRYYQDMLADPVRYRYGASLELAAKLGRWLPQPDLVFILDAPAEVLQARKQEVPFAESERQRTTYLALTDQFRRAHVIDASQPLEQVVNDVLTQTMAFLELRTAQRLNLTTPDAIPKLCKN